MHVNKMSVRMRGFTQYTRLADAIKIVLSKVKPLKSEIVTFNRATGRVLAEDVFSTVNVPAFDRSAVDGYAVRAQDTFGASAQRPVKLHIVGSVTIGSTTRLSIRVGETAKIMTGAMMPKGADAVIMLENTRMIGKDIEIFASVTPGKNVSALGEDVRAGDPVLKCGQVLRPQEIGMLASTGNLRVKVFRKPKVGILATGSELKEPSERLAPAKTTNTNSYSIAASVLKCGGLPKILGIVPDKPELIKRMLKKAALNDMVITSGGSSVGEYDLVPDAIANMGELLFHGVAIRPGSPTAFGVVQEKPVFSLSGFPVAALVAFDMLARPALWVMQGLPPDYSYPCVKAKLTRRVSSTLGRAEIVRVSLRSERGKFFAEPVATAGSSILSTMTRADGFIVVPEDVEGFEKGREVKVELYR